MAKISPQDLRFVSDLLARGVLEDVDPYLVNARNGFMVIGCPDCDQFEDKYKFYQSVCRCHRKAARVHPLGNLHGGPIRLSPEFRGNKFAEPDLLLHEIGEAIALKKITTLVLAPHLPCGKAYAHRLSFEEVLTHTFEGKRRIREAHPGLKIACFPQIDWGRGRKRTYFVSRDSFLRFMKNRKNAR